jgi:hypothetical protein
MKKGWFKKLFTRRSTSVMVETPVNEKVLPIGVAERRQKMVDMLDEGVKYYTDGGKRGMHHGGSCVYDTGDGGKCFVGRLLTDEELAECGHKGLMSAGVHNLLSKLDKVPGKLVGINKGFLSLCQSVHDNGLNWDGNTLTNGGLLAVRGVKKNINDGTYDG